MAKTWKSWAERCKDPRWQKKRLEKLEEAEWTCEHCGAGSSELHVHHKAYIGGRDPWEYSNDQMEALCDECHKAAQLRLDLMQEALSRLTPAQQSKAYGYVMALPSVPFSAVVRPGDNRAMSAAKLVGMADALHVSPKDMIARECK